MLFALEDKSEANLAGLATRVGVAEAKFNACMKSDKYLAALDASSTE